MTGRFRLSFLLNKNADLAASQLWSSFTRINVNTWYPALIAGRWLIQLLVNWVSLLVIGRYTSNNLLLPLALTIITLTALSPLFDDLDVHLRRYRSGYIHFIQKNRDTSGIFLIDNIFWFSLFKNLGTVIFWGVFTVLTADWRAILSLVVLMAGAYTIFVSRSFFRMRVNSISGMVSYALSGAVIATGSAWVWSAIFSLLSELRSAVLSGRGDLAGTEAVSVLYSSLLQTASDTYNSTWFIHAGVAALTLLAVAVFLVRSSHMGVTTPDGFRSHYVDRMTRSPRAASFGRVIVSQLRKLSPRHGHSELSVIVPMEFWLLVGFDLSIIPRLSNPAAILSLTAVQIYVIVTAVPRGFAAHYPAVFEFGSAIKTLRIFRQTGRPTRLNYYESTEKILRRLALPVTLFLTSGCTLLIAFLGFESLGIGLSIAALAIGAVFATLLSLPTTRLCMASPVDALEVLLRKSEALSPGMNFEDLVSLSGYRLLRSIRMMPIFLTQAAIVSAFIFLPLFGILQGPAWWSALGAVVLGLPVSVLVASHRSVEVS
jgi:membrane protein